MTGSASPGQIYVVSHYSPVASEALSPSASVVAAWTVPYAPPGINICQFSEQSIVRFSSFDGRIISAIANYPTAIDSQKSSPFPVLICIHGGPESQAVCGFLGRLNYFVAEMGFAILQPNVRGSSGYGKTFLDLDNGLLREDSVRDIGALLDWIQSQDNLDSSRVVVYGGSYGSPLIPPHFIVVLSLHQLIRGRGLHVSCCLFSLS
jgi:dipeptidyl aminopeptidase/acylaminoacyl peptidase